MAEHIRTFWNQILFCFSLLVCTVVAGKNNPVPLWKSLFMHYPQWMGFYMHDSGNYDCALKVNSVGMWESDVTYVTFVAEHVDIDMSVTSVDDITLVFKETGTWNKHSHFKGHSNLVFTGQILPHGSYHQFVGNVSSDELQNFGVVTLRPEVAVTSVVQKKTNDDLKYGLSIGVPVILAVCLTVAGITVLWWAHKKGYLRHIPRAYKNFTNPRNMESNPPTSSEHEMTGGEQYRIEQPSSLYI